MGTSTGRGQMTCRDMEVPGRGRNGLKAQHRLDNPDIGPTLQHQRPGGVTDAVRKELVNWPVQPRDTGTLPDTSE